MRIVVFLVALVLMATSAEARRVALVIGQNAYSVGLDPLANPVRDARRMAKLLADHGFEVIACDGKAPGCFDLDRKAFLDALARLESQAKGADLALVFFAGHGLASEQGNILAPTDADVDCTSGAVTQAVLVERIMAAAEPARRKLVILDACRDNPIRKACPNLVGKKLSFARIEAGAMQDFLLVTSTQFGQQALDGPKGGHSPFATALFAALEKNASIYFEQVMNEVARATYEATQKPKSMFQLPFLQIPGKVVGGAAPADCLAGKDCIGDARMAALAIENERLAADAAGVRNILEAEEKARGKRYTAEERQKRVAELEKTLASIGASTDPLRQEAKRLIGEGNVAAGQAKLDQALDADEKAIAEAERVAEEKRKVAARSARDLAVLTEGADVVKAVAYYQRATRLDASDPQTWIDYGEATRKAGRSTEANVAFEQAALRARAAGAPLLQSKAAYRQGDVAIDRGDLSGARRLYQAALAIIEPLAKTDPGNAGWQRELSVSHNKIGDVLRAQGNLPAALESFKASLEIADRLAKADPGNAGWQRDLFVSQWRVADIERKQGNLAAALATIRKGEVIMVRLAAQDPNNSGWQRDLTTIHQFVGDVLLDQGDPPAALESYRAVLAIMERLTKADPGNAGWQRDLSASHINIGDVLVARGNRASSLASYRAALAIIGRLAEADPGNAGWQRDLAVSHSKIGDVLVEQGNLPAALESFNASHTLFERLAKADPGNSGWQRDQSVSHNRIGDVFVEQGNLSAALESFKAALAIAERLAKADPGNAGWQHDVALSLQRVGLVAAQQGERGEARDACQRGLEIMQRLVELAPDHSAFKADLAWFERQIAALGK